jgi:hypothetical protein
MSDSEVRRQRTRENVFIIDCKCENSFRLRNSKICLVIICCGVKRVIRIRLAQIKKIIMNQGENGGFLGFYRLL